MHFYKPVGHFNSLAFRGTIFGNPTLVLLHGSGRTHSIKLFKFLSVFLNDFSSRLIMTGQHASKHDEIGAGSNGFGNITGASTSSILSRIKFVIRVARKILWNWPKNSRKWYELTIRERYRHIPKRPTVGDNPLQSSYEWYKQILVRSQPWRCQLQQKWELRPYRQSPRFQPKWYELEKLYGLSRRTPQKTVSSHWQHPSKWI